MSGDPDLATTSRAIQILDDLGADIIELGVPYSVSLLTMKAMASIQLLELLQVPQSSSKIVWQNLDQGTIVHCALMSAHEHLCAAILDLIGLDASATFSVACRIRWQTDQRYRQLQLEPC